MKPSWKDPEIEQFLEKQYGRTTAILANLCVNPPTGCGKPIGPFDTPWSEREYTISGLCQSCQDRTFPKGEGEAA